MFDNKLKWFGDAVFYEIYPQSFYDASGDGIGDIQGIIQKLDYIKDTGFNAVWINPCFDSPFKDAGYDVRDYKKVAPRYGTNDDLVRLFTEAHKRGMHILLDLVPGHTSEEHPWFVKSKDRQKNDLWNRYIWTDNWGTWASGLKTIFGESERNATYIVNFFKSQPALNYGFFKPDQKWQFPYTHPDCVATLDAMKDVMCFWLDAGCDGFRVDMAFSLVKFDDEENSANASLWKNVREMLDAKYPEAALVAEWSFPRRSLKCGFNADFLLAFAENSGYKSLFRSYELDGENNIVGADTSYFKATAKNADICRFLEDYLPHYEATKNDGFISLVTGNHDVPRISYSLDKDELSLCYAFIFTMPGIPFLYYGDEIAMHYLKDLPTKEGGYNRTGSRTPMQWSRAANMGFSTASADKLYLPADSAPDAPNVEDAERDASSLLHLVKKLTYLRKSEPDLGSAANFSVLYAKSGERPFIYKRGKFVIAVNPGLASCTVKPEEKYSGTSVFSIGDGSLESGVCVLGPQSFCVYKITGVLE